MFVRTISIAFQASLCLALVMFVAAAAQAQQAGDELPVIIPLEKYQPITLGRCSAELIRSGKTNSNGHGRGN